MKKLTKRQVNKLNYIAVQTGKVVILGGLAYCIYTKGKSKGVDKVLKDLVNDITYDVFDDEGKTWLASAVVKDL